MGQVDRGGAVSAGTFSLPLWVLLCAVAETIGMTAAASAALLADGLSPQPRSAGGSAMALLLVVAGGLVEGLALGVLQALGLARWVPGFRRIRWVAATTVVAGLGWAAASAPSQFASADDGSSPPAIALIGFGLLLGAAMGAVLGAAQAGGFRGRLRHPWRWIGISALAWTPAMAVILAGATTPEASWSPFATVSLAAATGAAAGAVLGLVSGLCWPLMDAPSRAHAARR